jgi:hypothetical protein
LVKPFSPSSCWLSGTVIRVTMPPRHKSSTELATHLPCPPALLLPSGVAPSEASHRCVVLFASRFSTGSQSSPLFTPAKQCNGRPSAVSRSASARQSAAELVSQPPSDDHRRMSPSPVAVFNRAPPPLLSMTISELLHVGHLSSFSGR